MAGAIGGVRYLAVNVYPTPHGWRAAVMVREPGRPYPRLVRRVDDVPLGDDVHDLRHALQRASEVLAEMAGELAPMIGA